MAELKAPKNLRATVIRCCATCKHYVGRKSEDLNEAWQECERDEGALTQSNEDFFFICDYFGTPK